MYELVGLICLCFLCSVMGMASAGGAPGTGDQDADEAISEMTNNGDVLSQYGFNDGGPGGYDGGPGSGHDGDSDGNGNSSDSSAGEE